MSYIYLNRLSKPLSFQCAVVAPPPEALNKGVYLEIESLGVFNIFQCVFD